MENPNCETAKATKYYFLLLDLYATILYSIAGAHTKRMPNPLILLVIGHRSPYPIMLARTQTFDETI